MDARRPRDRNCSTGPFYDVRFARQHSKDGKLVPSTDAECSSCALPEPAEWCWTHDPRCPLHKPLRNTERPLVLRCHFGVLGAPEVPGTMTFSHGSDFAQFVSDDGATRSWIAVSALVPHFTAIKEGKE